MKLPVPGFLAATFICASATAAAGTLPSSKHDSLSVTPEAGDATGFRPQEALVSLGGVWQSRGYGWIWSVEDGAIATYDMSGDFCLRDDDKSYDVEALDIRFEPTADGQQLKVTLGDDAYRYTFDRIDALPASCRAAHGSDPRAVFDAAAETLTAHYAFFGTRNVDWPAAVAKARAELTDDMDDEDLFDVLSTLLLPIPDSHVWLKAEVDDESLEYYPSDEDTYHANVAWKPEISLTPKGPAAYWNYRAAGRLLGDTVHSAADGAILYGTIGGDIGYLAVASMSGDSRPVLRAALDDAMHLFQGARAVIVDVSMNDGGYDTVARSIAERFTAERVAAYSKRAGDAAGEAPQTIYLEPGNEPRFTGPVYLMAGRDTISAAEVFVLAMRALPNVTQLGEPTDGSLSDELSKPLPNGWTLTLSNEVYLDSEGKLWEGVGIAPDVAVTLKPRRPTAADVKAARAVIDRIRAMM